MCVIFVFGKENIRYFDFPQFGQFIIRGLLPLLLSLLYWGCLWGMGFASRRCFLENVKCEIDLVMYSSVIQCLFPLLDSVCTVRHQNSEADTNLPGFSLSPGAQRARAHCAGRRYIWRTGTWCLPVLKR